MRKETPDMLHEAWMQKLHIAPFPLETDMLDLSPQFRKKLHDSLVSQGWQKDQTMIIATSSDVRLNGQPIQGRQRIIEISRILKEGKRFPLSDINIKFEEVNNIDELRAKRAAYEASATLSKDPRISQKWIEFNLKSIIRSQADKSQTKILAYLHECGFKSDPIAKEAIESVMDAMERKKQRFGQRQKGSMPRNDIGQTTIPDSVSDRKNWGIDETKPAPTTYDDVTSYLRAVNHSCQFCHKENSVWLNIAVGDERKLERVELAEIPKPSIEK